MTLTTEQAELVKTVIANSKALLAKIDAIPSNQRIGYVAALEGNTSALTFTGINFHVAIHSAKPMTGSKVRMEELSAKWNRETEKNNPATAKHVHTKVVAYSKYLRDLAKTMQGLVDTMEAALASKGEA